MQWHRYAINDDTALSKQPFTLIMDEKIITKNKLVNRLSNEHVGIRWSAPYFKEHTSTAYNWNYRTIRRIQLCIYFLILALRHKRNGQIDRSQPESNMAQIDRPFVVISM